MQWFEGKKTYLGLFGIIALAAGVVFFGVPEQLANWGLVALAAFVGVGARSAFGKFLEAFKEAKDLLADGKSPPAPLPPPHGGDEELFRDPRPGT